MKRQAVYVFMGMVVLGFAYTNCGQAGHIELKNLPVIENSVVSEAETPDTPTAPMLPPPTTVEQIITNCQNAKASNRLLVLKQTINFEDSRVETKKKNICDFSSAMGVNTAGNLPMANSSMQARYEQNRKLSLPEGAVICDIQMKNELQSFRYDDVFFFSFNGYLLASNNKTQIQRRLQPQPKKLSEHLFTDFYVYDWATLRGGAFANRADDYCLGEDEGLSKCSWPISERQGRINFSFAQALLISMSAGRASHNQVFSFAITGDDNPSIDCYHEKLEFAMTVDYYIPQVQ